MKTRKTICKHLLEPVYIHRFIDDPAGIRKSIASNQSLNKRKGALIDAGKKAMGLSPSNSLTSVTGSSSCSPQSDPSAPRTPSPKKVRY